MEIDAFGAPRFSVRTVEQLYRIFTQEVTHRNYILKHSVTLEAVINEKVNADRHAKIR